MSSRAVIPSLATLRAAWRLAWNGDPLESDLPMQGEHRVARSRVIVVGTLTLLSLIVVSQDPGNTGYRRAVPVNLVCLALALVVLVATRRGTRPTWISVLTSIGDVSMVSLLHVAELLQTTPSAAVNGRITFAGYFFALIGTCVRWDPRLPLVAGAVAGAQYALIAAAGAAMWPSTPTPDVLAYGGFDWGVQIERVVTLVLFSVSCAGIARWSVQLRASSTHDALTGLLNRGTFEGHLHNEWLLAMRRGAPLSLAIIDLDEFKQVNDRWGHAAGDTVLREVAAILRRDVRRSDLVARWGGEEFMVALPGATLPDAADLVEELRTRIADTPVTLSGGRDVRVSLSAGVAVWPVDGATAQEVIACADERLLIAKRAGRNRVVTAVPTAAAV